MEELPTNLTVATPLYFFFAEKLKESFVNK